MCVTAAVISLDFTTWAFSTNDRELLWAEEPKKRVTSIQDGLAPMTSPTGLRSPVTRCFCHGHHGVSALPTYLVRIGGRISEEELKLFFLISCINWDQVSIQSSTVAELMCPSSAASRFQKSAVQDRYFSKAQRRTHRTWLSCRFTWCHTTWPKSQIPTNTRHNSDGENKKSCCVTLVQRGDGGFLLLSYL